MVADSWSKQDKGRFDSGDVKSGAPSQGALGSLTRLGSVLIMRPDAVVVGYGDGGVQIFHPDTGKALSPEMLMLATEGSHGVALSPDGKMMVFDDASFIRVFDTITGRNIAEIAHEMDTEEGCEDQAKPLFSQDGGKCYLLDRAGQLLCYDTRKWLPLGHPMVHPNREACYLGFTLSKDDHFAVTFDSPGEMGPKGFLQVWDTTSFKAIGPTLKASDGIRGEFLAKSERLLISPGRGKAWVAELPSMKQTLELRQHDDVFGPKVLPTPDGESLLSWGYDQWVNITSVKSGKLQGLCNASASVQQVLVSPDPTACFVVYDNTAFLLQGHHDLYVFRYSVPDMKISQTLRILNYVSEVQLAPNGSRLAVIQGNTDQESVKLYDAVTLLPLLP